MPKTSGTEANTHCFTKSGDERNAAVTSVSRVDRFMGIFVSTSEVALERNMTSLLE